jgi:translation initiation factor IF-3
LSSFFRINHQIRAKELRLLGAEGENIGVVSLSEAQRLANEAGLDLIEISPNATPPVGKIADFGKFQYEQNKKQKKMKAGAKPTETKSVQIKVATGDHDLELKAKKVSEWLGEGHRVKVELFLSGRMKYMQEQFLKERLERILNLITVEYKIADPVKRSPKGFMTTLEKAK